ncbi:GLPGLI family protein [Pedobacter sp. Leaf176]|uniref:GLPGLI family protein n=1 Tax=Pedobacter sp. Leaf176 TaxID=1736286 RepID=UPI0006FF51E8|nr:GLPGLI family protein [Pedobacter sp. Leaf176]KQR72370.1 hypothetical protein ASF92_03530 [Pedobacter sp. Leaf176]
MKNFFLISIFCLFFKVSHAQEKLNKIEYNYSINGDTSSVANLYFNSSVSFFEIINKKLRDSIARDNLNDQYIITAVRNIKMPYGTILRNDLDTLLTRTKSFDDKTYLIKESAVKIDWNLINDHKKINDLNCLKAEGYFRGRNYVAWYTPDIPTTFGPLKFWGLPGLILEIKDDNNFVLINARKIEIPSKETVDFNKLMSNYDVKISLQQFVKNLKNANAFGKQYMERILSKIPKKTGVKVTVSNYSISTEIGEAIERVYEWELDKK